MRRPGEPKIAAAVGFGFLVLAVIATLSHRETKRAFRYDDDISHTQQALLALKETKSALMDAEATVRGYLVSGKEGDLKSYWSDVKEMDRHLNELEAMVTDPSLQSGIPGLRAAVNNDLRRLGEAAALRRSGQTDSAARVVLGDVGDSGLVHIGRTIGRMEDEAQGLLSEETRRATTTRGPAILSLFAQPLFAAAFLWFVYLVVARLLAGRTRDEARIRRQREMLGATLSSIGDGVIATDTAGCITFMNSVAHAVTGWDPPKAMGKPLPAVLQVVDNETHEAVECCPQKVMRNGVSVDLADQALLVSRDGRQVPIDASQAPILDAEGVVVGAVTVFHDVSERRQTEQARRTAEQNVRDIIESIGDAFYALDREWCYTYVNEQAAKLAGRTREALIGKNIWEAFPEKVGGVDYVRLHQAMDGHAKAYFESFDEPSKLWCETSAYPSSHGLSVFVRDITKRKRTHQQLREQFDLLDHAHDGISVRGVENDRTTYWNKGAERIYGWAANEVLGKDLRDFLYAAGTEEYDEAREILFEKGQWEGELHQQTKSGKRIVAETRLTLVRDDKGEPKSVLAINTDVTEKKALEAQFYRAQRMESIGILAGGIAHDLNNLLSPITTAVSLLRRRLPAEEDQHVLSVLDNNAHNAADLIRQVLSFGKGVTGERMPLQPAHLIKEIAETLAHTLPKSIHIEVSVPDDLWTISGDPTQIHQVLMNLCVNARDAMPRGGTLRIKAENTNADENYAAMHVGASPGRYVLIRVTDTGVGIPSEILDRIFEPFFTTKEPGKGTGLGLSTSLTIVKSHEGFINVYSEHGRGTEFKVYLPRAEPGGIVQTEPEDSALPAGCGELILLVDDEVGVLQIAKATLEAYGYRVMTAPDGPEALMLYAQHHAEIKAAVIDAMMPFMEGPATIRAMESLNPDLNVIMSSGLDTDVKLIAPQGARRHAFLRKPYTAGQLLKTLAEVLGR
jgi:PAS domain S-box-containing protein